MLDWRPCQICCPLEIKLLLLLLHVLVVVVVHAFLLLYRNICVIQVS